MAKWAKGVIAALGEEHREDFPGEVTFDPCPIEGFHSKEKIRAFHTQKIERT